MAKKVAKKNKPVVAKGGRRAKSMPEKLLSMTGFGQSAARLGQCEIAVEIRTVNHRFLDISVKLPSVYSAFEAEVVKPVRETLRRGRVEIYISRKVQNGGNGNAVVFNSQLFRAYMNTARKALHGYEGGKSAEAFPALAATFLSRREVLDFVAEEGDVKSEHALLLKQVEGALVKLLAMRKLEGQALAGELERLISAVEREVRRISERVSSTPKDIKERLRQRLHRLLDGQEVDSERLMQEVAILADRADVTEEIKRLGSHILQFRAAMSERGDCGRKLEFLVQELGREINTIGSKAQDAQVTVSVVEAKSLLEKIREQVQNVE